MTFSVAHFHLFELWTLTSTQLLQHIRFLCLFPSLYPFLSPSLDTEISRRHSDIGCTPLLYALETSTASKGKFTVAIMNALMFQPQNTPKWGHRRTRVIMAHNTLIITIKCIKIIDADIIDANLSLKLDETKFKYTYIIYPSSIKYFSIRERERIWYHQRHLAHPSWILSSKTIRTRKSSSPWSYSPLLTTHGHSRISKDFWKSRPHTW